MEHAREDYNSIQDASGRIPENEPVFLLRAQDIAAPVTVKFWADLVEKMGASENIVASARAQMNAMRQWQAEGTAKVPDMP